MLAYFLRKAKTNAIASMIMPTTSTVAKIVNVSICAVRLFIRSVKALFWVFIWFWICEMAFVISANPGSEYYKSITRH